MEGWDFGGLGLELGFGAYLIWCEASGFFWGWGSLHKHIRITLGIIMVHLS